MFVENAKSQIIQNYWVFVNNRRKVNKSLHNFSNLSFEQASILIRNKELINQTNSMISSLFKYSSHKDKITFLDSSYPPSK